MGEIKRSDLHGDLQARLDKIGELNDQISASLYTEEVKQEPIFSVPANAIKGQVPINAKGKSVINVLGDIGDFEGVISSKYSLINATVSLDFSNKVFGNSGLKITMTGSASAVELTKDKLKMDSSKHYLITAYIKNGNTTGGLLISAANTGGASSEGGFIKDNSKFTRVGLRLSPTQVASLTNIWVYISSGSVGQYAYVDGLMVNEITEEEYNTLSVDKLMVKYPYHNGIGSVNDVKVKSVGKNLVKNGNCEEGITQWIPDKTGTTISVINGKFTINNPIVPHSMFQYINVKPYTNYYVNAEVSGNLYIKVYDEKATQVLLDGSGTFNTGNFSRIRFYINKSNAGDGYASKIQLEEGTIATPYEPYVESISPLPTMHSLPNGVKDEIVDGKFIKRIGEYVLQASDLLVLDTAHTNIDVAYTSNTFLTGHSPWAGFADHITSWGIPYVASKDGLFNQISNTMKTFTNADNRMYFIFPNDYYTNIEQVRIALAGTKIIYELAQPIVQDLVTPLTVYPNGTISVESDKETTIPELTMRYPLNMGAVVEELNDGVSQLGDVSNYLYESKELLREAVTVLDTMTKTHMADIIQQPEWITPTLMNGWVNGENASYSKDSLDIVRFRGYIASGTTTNGTTLFVLPPEYRPSTTIERVTQSSAGNVNTAILALLQINTDGVVKIMTNDIKTALHLNGILFRLGE